MKQTATRELFSYWNELRQERAAPGRLELDPTAIRGALPSTFMLEVDPPRSYPLRIAGSRISALFRREVLGETFTGLWHRDDQPTIERLLSTVLDETVPAVIGVTAAPAQRALVELEMLILPLRHEGKTHARLLGALTPTAIPSWLGLIGVESLRIATSRFIVDETTPPIATGMGNPSPPIAQAYQTRRHGHLLVLEGGR
ncbi:hypothetical protein SAMN05443249_5313 [Beijerinckia sp. 28-YEA-48]|nr:MULTISPECIES: PAS domain-containing protein [unclassified Beijerinckia]SED41478.1 hypothetical protein SAMN05443249_5313 [Beijerinckia sp. 28-YEA-48]